MKMSLKDCPIIRKEIRIDVDYEAIEEGMIIGTDEDNSFIAIFNQEEKLIFSTKDITDGKVFRAYARFSSSLRKYYPETYGYFISVEGVDRKELFLEGIYTFKGKQLIPLGRYFIICDDNSTFLKYGIMVTYIKSHYCALYSYEGECIISEKMGYCDFLRDKYCDLLRDKFGFYLACLGDKPKNTGKYVFDPYSYDFKRILPEKCYMSYKFFNGNMVFANIDENRVASYGLMDAMGNIKRYADCIDYAIFETKGNKEIVILYKDNNSIEIYSEDFQLLDELPCYGRVELMPVASSEFTRYKHWGKYKPDGIHYELLFFTQGKVNRVFPVEEYKATKIYMADFRKLDEPYFIVFYNKNNSCSFYKFLNEKVVPMKIKITIRDEYVMITDQDLK